MQVRPARRPACPSCPGRGAAASRSLPRAAARRRGSRRARRVRRSRTWPLSLATASAQESPHGCDGLLDHAPGRCDDHPEIEADRPVGDVLEVVRELLRPRLLATHARLREPGEPGPDDETLPVLGNLLGELLEERRTDRPRPDDGHVAAEDIPELRYLVELRRTEPTSQTRDLRLGADRELLPVVGTETRLGVSLERPVLEHVEDAPVPPDPQAAVEERRSRSREEDDRDDDEDRQCDD